MVVHLKYLGHLSLVLCDDDVSRAVIGNVMTGTSRVGGIHTTPDTTSL